MIDYNVTKSFFETYHNHLDKLAFVIPIKYDNERIIEERLVTFKEFAELVGSYQNGLVEHGLKKGDRVIVLTTINLEFYAFVLALFSLGIPCIFLDPGIGKEKIKRAIQKSNAKAIFSVKRLLKWWPLLRILWPLKRYTTDQKVIGCNELKNLKSNNTKTLSSAHLDKDDELLITFTSGSTGNTKGSNRNAYNVYMQFKSMEEFIPNAKDEVDFPTLLMFGFMNVCYGATTILPAVDFGKIGDISPRVIVEQMKKWKVTRSVGAYSFNKKVVDYLVESGESIESLKLIAIGGSPVTKKFCRDIRKAYPNATGNIAYGSTEVSPISVAKMDDYVSSDNQGFLVGKACADLEMLVVRFPENISSFGPIDAKDYESKTGDWGEVIIRGKHVVQNYIDDEIGTKENKVRSERGDVWHRTKDVGYKDESGQLWLIGRLADMILLKEQEPIHPYILECEINERMGFGRSALIQTKEDTHLFIENTGVDIDEKQIADILNAHGLTNTFIHGIDKIPVDDRHNSKVNRVELRKRL